MLPRNISAKISGWFSFFFFNTPSFRPRIKQRELGWIKPEAQPFSGFQSKAQASSVSTSKKALGAAKEQMPVEGSPVPGTLTPYLASRVFSTSATKVPQAHRGGSPSNVAPSSAHASGLPPISRFAPSPQPTHSWRSSRLRRRRDGRRTWPNGSARLSDGGGAGCAAQGRAAEAPMSVRRVRSRRVRETPR